MKIRKLLAVALTATLLCGGINVNAYAAEVNTAETVTDVESTEESTNEDTEGKDTSLTEEGSEEQTEITETEESTEGIVESETEEETTGVKETEEEKAAREKAEKKAAKKAEKKAAKKAAEEEAKKAAEEAAKPSYTEEQLRLLSALIFCEAGSEPYAGKLAVGIVVMNRVESKLFPGTLKDVIYQRSQFGPARNGTLNKALAAYDAGKFTSANHKDSIKAAKEALEGAKKVTYNGKEIDMKSTLYFSGYVRGAKFTIANHQFK